jgi:Flp pilus assembly protein TadD
LVVAGYSLYHAGNHDKAAVMFVLALRVDPSNLDALELLGVSLQHSGSTACAQAFHNRVLSLDSSRPVPILNLGLLGLFSGDPSSVPAAIANLETAASICARDAATLHLAAAAAQALGSAHAMRGDAPAALRHLAVCLRLTPDSTPCRLSAAAVHAEADRPDLAVRMFVGVLAAARPLDLARAQDRLLVLELCLHYGAVAAWAPQRRLLPLLGPALEAALRRGEELPPKAASAALFLPVPDRLLLPVVRALAAAAAAAAPAPPAPWPVGAGRYEAGTVHVAYVSADFGAAPRGLG